MHPLPRRAAADDAEPVRGRPGEPVVPGSHEARARRTKHGAAPPARPDDQRGAAAAIAPSDLAWSSRGTRSRLRARRRPPRCAAVTSRRDELPGRQARVEHRRRRARRGARRRARRGSATSWRELHRAGRALIVVTSGAIARGMGVMGMPLRPRAIDELQAASAVGQGKLYQVYDELLRARGVPTAQVLLTFFDMSARTHYLNARQTLRKLLEWRVVPVINENDTTTTDEISFGNNDFLAAQVAILLGAELLLLLTDAGGVFTADPRADPDARARRRGRATSTQLEGLDIGHATSPLGLRRDALEGRGRRDGDRRRDPDRDRQRARAGHDPRRCGRRTGRHQRSRRRQAATRASSCGSSTPSRPAAACSSTPAPPARCARAGRACCRSGSSRWPASSTPATRSRSPRRRARRQGDLATTRRPSCASVRGLKSAAVRELLPRASDEAVHRDYFVLA